MKKLIAIMIIFLFFVMVIFPSSGIQINKNIIITSDRGNTLYVGGNGSGNYSKIQDAIDDASDGNTVFVYDDSSPYYENIVIDKSISLIGEDKNSTIIEDKINQQIICIKEVNVEVSGFSLINGNGIEANNPNYIKIIDNNFLNCYTGILLDYADESYVISNYFSNCYNPIKCFLCVATISNNYIISSISREDESFSDILCLGGNLTITDNIFIGDIKQDEKIGVCFQNVINSTIEKNKFSGYDWGAIVLVDYSRNNIIFQNNFTNNNISISIWGKFGSKSNKILNNNFINNNFDAEFGFYSSRNIWEGNYWDSWIGLRYKLPIFQKFPHIIFGPWPFGFGIDWYPLKEPYDI